MEVHLDSEQGFPLVFRAPLSGLVIPLEEVPDPVFAQKMVGEGLAIDPTSQTLMAPCPGEIVQIHPSSHALTLRHESGLQLLMHIGLDTVALKGKGFKTLVKMGDLVDEGTPLIEFDADFVAGQVPSLISPIIILPGDVPLDFEVTYGATQSGKKGFLTIRPAGPVETERTSSSKRNPKEDQETLSAPLTLKLPNGLHARPASLLVQASKRFSAEVTLVYQNRRANCLSLIQLLELALPKGATFQLVATGEQKDEAVIELSRLLNEMKEEAEPTPAKRTSRAPSSSPDGKRLAGVTAAPGVTAGQIFILHHQEILPEQKGQGQQVELKSLFAAIKKVTKDLQELQSQVKRTAGSAQAAIFSAHQDILEDPSLLSQVEEEIEKGSSAAWSVKQVFQQEVARLEVVPNELIAARANDLKDVGHRLVAELTGIQPALPDIPAHSILIAEDLSPSDTAGLDRNQVAGFCTLKGGSSSHVAILARSLGIPALAAIDAQALNLQPGQQVILNATNGYLELDPAPEKLKQLVQLQKTLNERRKEEEKSSHLPARTRDDHRVLVFANFASHEEADRGVSLGAEGVGLMRSEFLFLNRETAPSEEEQFQIYSHMTQAMGAERPTIIRTLDFGGDKPLAYCPMPEEENPFLGERGIRLLLKEQDLFRTQIRALLRAAQMGPLRIMLPMVTNLEEIHQAKSIIREEQVALGVGPVPVGIMIEVPAAAVMADRLANEVDFFSIGTNDLTQYVLAMDRNHPSLARQVDGLHPAVLALIEMTTKAAQAAGIEVGVCGGIAGDLAGVPLLVGLGVEELSVSLPSVPGVKARVRELELVACRKLAQRALTLSSADDVRALVNEEMPEWSTGEGKRS